eukprot:15200225-Heterocapsa_arctica.AAC.1
MVFIEDDIDSEETFELCVRQAKQAAESVLMEYAGTCFGMQAKGRLSPSTGPELGGGLPVECHDEASCHSNQGSCRQPA